MSAHQATAVGLSTAACVVYVQTMNVRRGG